MIHNIALYHLNRLCITGEKKVVNRKCWIARAARLFGWVKEITWTIKKKDKIVTEVANQSSTFIFESIKPLFTNELKIAINSRPHCCHSTKHQQLSEGGNKQQHVGRSAKLKCAAVQTFTKIYPHKNVINDPICIPHVTKSIVCDGFVSRASTRRYCCSPGCCCCCCCCWSWCCCWCWWAIGALRKPGLKVLRRGKRQELYCSSDKKWDAPCRYPPTDNSQARRAILTTAL